jgi:hypothetical protein
MTRTAVINARGRDHAAIRRDAGFVYVGRYNARCGYPCSPWANPFKPGMTWAEACRICGASDDSNPPYQVLDAAAAVRWYVRWLATQPLLMNSLGELRGKTLVCWCCNHEGDGEPDQPCHAVALARLADGIEEVPDAAVER